MTRKTPIRIIKRDERNRQEKTVAQNETARKTPQEAAREMVNTVTNWVNELQQKRRAETSRAIQKLFPEPAQPNEA
jgi:hypothetical protein